MVFRLLKMYVPQYKCMNFVYSSHILIQIKVNHMNFLNKCQGKSVSLMLYSIKNTLFPLSLVQKVLDIIFYLFIKMKVYAPAQSMHPRMKPL